jgi:hypothetical protein
MCVQPFLVLEQRAKQQRNLPVLISFDAGRKRAGIAHDIAPMLNEIGSAVQRSFKRQITSNRRHGCHLSRSPGDAGGGTSMLLRVPDSLVNIAQLPGFIDVGPRELFDVRLDWRLRKASLAASRRVNSKPSRKN